MARLKGKDRVKAKAAAAQLHHSVVTTPNPGHEKLPAEAEPDVATINAKHDELLANAEQQVDDYDLARSALVDTISRFISGEASDFEAVMGGFLLWGKAKRAACGACYKMGNCLTNEKNPRPGQAFRDRFKGMADVMFKKPNEVGL